MHRAEMRIFRSLFVIVLVTAWIFSGWPRIFNFPERTKTAEAAVAFRGTPKIGSASNGGDVTLTFDTGGSAPQVGDIVFLFGGRGNSSDATAWGPITGGYTPIATIDSTGPKLGVWYKVMGSTPDTQVQGEGGASGSHGVVYGAYVIDGSTVDSALFDQTASSTGQMASWVANGPSIVTQTAGSLVITHAAASLNDSSRGTVSGYTLIPGATVNETDDFVSEAAYKVAATAGTEDPPAWSSWSAGTGGAITIALKPKASTTLTTGTDPSVTTVAPGSGIRDAGAFTFQTSAGTDSVSSTTVILAGSGTPYDGLSEVRITSDDGATTYFTAISNPSSNTLTFSGGTPITANSTETQYKIRVTPKTHVGMAVPPGAAYDVAPYVSDWNSTNTKLGTDANANTLTIDNLSPSNVTNASGTAADARVSLSWANPADSDFGTTTVLRSTTAIGSTAPTEGVNYTVGTAINATTTVACVVGSAASSCVDTDVVNGTTYHYKIFTGDSRGNYDVGTVPTGSPFTPALASTVSCDTSIASTSFGALSTSAVTTASPNASTTVSCTYAGGCTLSIQDAGNGASPGLATTTPAYLIPSTNTTLSIGTEGYGIQAATTAVGSGAVLNVNPIYEKTGNDVGGLTIANATLASSTAAFTNREIIVTHKAAIGILTNAGIYSDTITYSCTGNP